MDLSNEMELQSQYTNISLPPLNTTLEKLNQQFKENNVIFSLSLLDKFGHTIKGKLVNVNFDTGILLLTNSDNELTFFDLSHLAHFKISDADKHLKFFKHCAQEYSEFSSFCIDEYIAIMQEMLKQNCKQIYRIHIENLPKQLSSKQNVRSLLDNLCKLLVDIAKDEFYDDFLNSIKDIELIHKTNSPIRLKKDITRIILYFDSRKSLPINISTLLEDKLNKVF